VALLRLLESALCFSAAYAMPSSWQVSYYLLLLTGYSANSETLVVEKDLVMERLIHARDSGVLTENYVGSIVCQPHQWRLVIVVIALRVVHFCITMWRLYGPDEESRLKGHRFVLIIESTIALLYLTCLLHDVYFF